MFKLGNTLNKQNEKQQLQEDSSETLLEEVPGFDGVKVLQIAAGAEHSAVVTGKMVEGGEISSLFQTFSVYKQTKQPVYIALQRVEKFRHGVGVNMAS